VQQIAHGFGVELTNRHSAVWQQAQMAAQGNARRVGTRTRFAPQSGQQSPQIITLGDPRWHVSNGPQVGKLTAHEATYVLRGDTLG
jgi:hypothetical protein